MEISAEQLIAACKGVLEFDFTPERRTSSCHFNCPEPGILITKRHIENALRRRHLRIVNERELVLWATMILLNDAYDIDEAEEGLVAEWLNDLSLELDASSEHEA